MKRVVIGLLGNILDRVSEAKRWSAWRPSVSICRQPHLPVDRFELLYHPNDRALADATVADIATVSPHTQLRLHEFRVRNPWDFGLVYETLFDFARAYPFDTEQEEYLIHITTGTHVAQICLFLLTEARWLPGKLLQTAPGQPRSEPGYAHIIDLDLSRYDSLGARFQLERNTAVSFLKGGIETRNLKFNQLIERIERVAVATRDPLLLMGPTGAGKSALARRIFDLKKSRHAVKGVFVDVNCATVRGDGAMSTLFGHTKGAFTGALKDRPGLLRTADHGVLFLDEIGELGLDEQAMLLRALEEKTFLPLGSDTPAQSDFQLIAGTNRDLQEAVRSGAFREDLLARINLWTFTLPGLRDRPEDIEPNLQFELEQFARRTGQRASFNTAARGRFLAFARSGEAFWKANFRDLNAAIVRMATLGPGGRITIEVVEEELMRLRQAWQAPTTDDRLVELLGAEAVAAMDLFDRLQLAPVVAVCARHRSLSEAGRELFATSRGKRSSTNDADRLRKYLKRFGLEFAQLQQPR